MEEAAAAAAARNDVGARGEWRNAEWDFCGGGGGVLRIAWIGVGWMLGMLGMKRVWNKSVMPYSYVPWVVTSSRDASSKHR